MRGDSTQKVWRSRRAGNRINRKSCRLFKVGDLVTRRMLTFFFILTTLLNVNSEAQADKRVLKECRIQTQKLTLQPGQKPLRLAGTVLKTGTMEYHLKVKSDLTVDVQLKTDSQLTLDIYSLVPPTPIQKKVAQWSGPLSKSNEYTFIVNNCSGSTNVKYQLLITLR